MANDDKIDKLHEAEKNWKRDLDESIERYRIEEREHWRRWCEEIPFIEFPNDWRVQIIPPFCGAMARFRVKLPDTQGKNSVSVYLDCYDRLGYYGQPYWEVYPYKGDTGRCDMQDTKTLLEMIADRGEDDGRD